MLKKEALITFVDRMLPELKELRQHLHTIPELAGKEHETRKVLKETADRLHPLYWQPKIGTDLVFELPGRDPGKVIGLRSDMDGLPISEKTGVPYCSKHPGMMHACGHDGHMAILIGAARTAAAFQAQLPVTIRFIFQPGEEVLCLGAELVEKGVCDGLSAVYGYHNWGGVPVGSISSKPGVFYAAARDFRLLFRGTGTHGALPERGNNPLVPTADAVMRLQGIHQRFAREAGAVISVCSVHGGESSNVIPSEAELRGTVRYISNETGREIEAAMIEAAATAAAVTGTEHRLEFARHHYIPLVNDAERTDTVRAAAEHILGPGTYIPAETHTMGAEDFAFYLARTPGCMFALGTGFDRAPIHSDNYDFQDESIRTGVLVLSALMFGKELA